MLVQVTPHFEHPIVAQWAESYWQQGNIALTACTPKRISRFLKEVAAQSTPDFNSVSSFPSIALYHIMKQKADPDNT